MFSRSCHIESHGKKCVERYYELASKTTEQLYKVATPCMDDHQNKENTSVEFCIFSEITRPRSSTGAEESSRDAGFRMDGIPVLDQTEQILIPMLC